MVRIIAKRTRIIVANPLPEPRSSGRESASPEPMAKFEPTHVGCYSWGGVKARFGFAWFVNTIRISEQFNYGKQIWGGFFDPLRSESRHHVVIRVAIAVQTIMALRRRKLLA